MHVSAEQEPQVSQLKHANSLVTNPEVRKMMDHFCLDLGTKNILKSQLFRVTIQHNLQICCNLTLPKTSIAANTMEGNTRLAQ